MWVDRFLEALDGLASGCRFAETQAKAIADKIRANRAVLEGWTFHEMGEILLSLLVDKALDAATAILLQINGDLEHDGDEAARIHAAVALGQQRTELMRDLVAMLDLVSTDSLLTYLNTYGPDAEGRPA